MRGRYACHADQPVVAHDGAILFALLGLEDPDQADVQRAADG